MTAKEIRKEAIKGFVTLATMVIVALVTVSLQTEHDDSVILDERLNEKVDKSDFKARSEQVDKQLDLKVNKETFDAAIQNQNKQFDLLLEEIRLNRTAIQKSN